MPAKDGFARRLRGSVERLDALRHAGGSIDADPESARLAWLTPVVRDLDGWPDPYAPENPGSCPSRWPAIDGRPDSHAPANPGEGLADPGAGVKQPPAPEITDPGSGRPGPQGGRAERAS